MRKTDHDLFHPYLSYFVDSELENKYRSNALGNIVKMITFTVSIFTINVIFLLISDLEYSSFGKDVELIVMTRILFILLSIIMLTSINFVRNPKFIDIMSLSFMILLAYQNYIVHTINPNPSTITYSIELVVVLGLYLVFPIPIVYQLTGAFLFTLTNFASLSKGEISDDNQYLMSLLFLSTNFMGLVLSSVFNRTARRLFYQYNTEKDLRKKIKATQKDIRIMQELIPICSSCKKVRDDSGFWNQVDTYMNSISNAEFIIDECDHCRGSDGS